MFESRGVELLGRWWNGRYGRIARRDLWLLADESRYMVQARIGDSDAPVEKWQFACEPDARAKVDELIRTGGDGWRELTDLYRRRNT